MRSQVIGSGFVTGENLVTNDQLARIMDTSDAWIRERSGVETRYYVEQGTSTSDLGLGAARKALADAGIAKEEVDYIVFATMTPDHYFPGCGGILQEKLGVAHVPALDIRQQCTGFIYGLQVADVLLKAGEARTVLLVGAEVHSGFMPWTAWDFLFGRGGQPPSEEEKAVITGFRDKNASSVTKNATSISGAMPKTNTASERKPMEKIISPKWNRAAVLTSRSRSV